MIPKNFSNFWWRCFGYTIFWLWVTELGFSELPLWAETIISHPKLIEVSKQPVPAIAQGNKIKLNGRTHSIPWSRWREGNSLRIGISDTGASALLGIELLSTQSPHLQPVQWFYNYTTLKTKSIGPYRYLDLTNFAPLAYNFTVTGDTLEIRSPLAKVENVSVVEYSWGQQILIDLDRPTFWQVSQNKREGLVKLEGIANSYLLSRFAPPVPAACHTNREEVEVEAENNNNNLECLKPEPPLLIIEDKERQTWLKINLPEGKRLKTASSVNNTNQIIIDVRPDAVVSKDILWRPGIRWRQRYVKLVTPVSISKSDPGGKSQLPSLPKIDLFPVFYLEIEPKQANIYLEPITANRDTLPGISPLLKTANSNQAVAAINGGFFNRNNQLPLGAIRRHGRWLSGPILNRGAIAWDNQGNFKIARLSLEETLTTATGESLPIILLNTGYVKAGIARYNSMWGKSYTTLIDDEIVVEIRNNRVVAKVTAGLAGEDSFAIPTDGYLLTFRAFPSAANKLELGSIVRLRSLTFPPDFTLYPHILGAGPLLLENGYIVLDGAKEKFSKNFNQQAASRSAIATTKEGKLLMVAVHNRTGWRGPTLTEMARIMKQLGAVNALNLDGGSSTSLYLGGQLIDRSPVTAARVHNGIGIFIKND